MSNSEVLVWSIQSTNPEMDRTTMLHSEYRAMQFPKISRDVEQGIHLATAEIQNILIWSQLHLAEDESFINYRKEDLDERAIQLINSLDKLSKHGIIVKSLQDLALIINANLKGNNPHTREAKTSFTAGSMAAKEVFAKPELNSSRFALPLEQNDIENMDQQAILISSYYCVWEALKGKKTTPAEYKITNPFTPLLSMLYEGARNIAFEQTDGGTKVNAQFFSQNQEAVYISNWEYSTSLNPQIR